MSGDVQPRKRKDKKRKKDDIGVEETRGTSAIFGEGDIFMHSPNDHGTGGHWCAKIIFFSLLAVLVALVGLIILENRGLSELEANSVESRYSGVLEGWLEDTPENDHHNLRHQNDDLEDDKEADEIEERIQREESDEEPISMELPSLPEADDDLIQEISKEVLNHGVDDEESEDDLRSADEDYELPLVEHITAPAGNPLPEIDDDSTEVPGPDTLAEEEEYEKKQEEIRREEEEASNKDGGNNIDDWPEEPNDPYWRKQLDQAEEELHQDWLN